MTSAPLIFISFLNAALLALFIPVRRVNSSVPALAMVLWLTATNIIHGINAAAWAGNLSIHVPVWCDLTTRIVLGQNVAIPGALLCIASELELHSSKRKIRDDRSAQTFRRILYLIPCYIFPLLYITLFYWLAQDYRFTLMKDFGPFAAVHPSYPALALIWGFPLLLSCSAIVTWGASIAHTQARSNGNWRADIERRVHGLTISIYNRRRYFTVLMAIVMLSASGFALFSVPTVVSWTTFSEVHSGVAQVHLAADPDEITGLTMEWWTSTIVSIFYLIFAFSLGQETRDMGQWIVDTYLEFPRNWNKAQEKTASAINDLLKKVKRVKNLKPLALPTHTRYNASSSTAGISCPKIAEMELKSGWDDMIEDNKKSKFGGSLRSLPRYPPRTPTPTLSLSRSLSSASSQHNTIMTPRALSPMPMQDPFATEASTYMLSPPAKTLCLESPPTSPPRSPSRSPNLAQVNIVLPSPVSLTHNQADKLEQIIMLLPAQKDANHLEAILHTPTVPDDAKSTISSIIGSYWPSPPEPEAVDYTLLSSRPPSDMSYNGTIKLGYPQPRSKTLAGLEPVDTPPFQGRTVSPIPGNCTPPPVLPLQIQKRPSLSSLRKPKVLRGRDIMKDVPENVPTDVILMNVVHETEVV